MLTVVVVQATEAMVAKAVATMAKNTLIMAASTAKTVTDKMARIGTDHVVAVVTGLRTMQTAVLPAVDVAAGVMRAVGAMMNAAEVMGTIWLGVVRAEEIETLSVSAAVC